MSGNFNFKEFEGFAKQLEKLAKADTNQLFQDAAKELAARLLTLVTEKTPVGNYPAGSGMVGGTLKRGWTAGKDTNIQSFLNTLQIKVSKNAYIIEVINPVEYASYVENGHRTANHKGWVMGKFMMRESVDELQKIAPKVLERRIERFLKECLND